MVTISYSFNQKSRAVKPPNNVILVLKSGNDLISWDKALNAIESEGLDNPKIYKIPLCDRFEDDCIIDAIRAHVLKSGTIDELVLVGHGSPGRMGVQYSEGSRGLYIFSLLHSIGELEDELCTKITNRIVFNGCSTFSKFNNREIEWFRKYADIHDMEVVGTTSLLSGTFYGFDVRCARFVQFTPQGGVIRDRLDDRYAPLALLNSDHSWTDYHLGHSQEEAETLMKQDRKEEKKTVGLNFLRFP